MAKVKWTFYGCICGQEYIATNQHCPFCGLSADEAHDERDMTLEEAYVLQMGPPPEELEKMKDRMPEGHLDWLRKYWASKDYTPPMTFSEWAMLVVLRPEERKEVVRLERIDAQGYPVWEFVTPPELKRCPINKYIAESSF